MLLKQRKRLIAQGFFFFFLKKKNLVTITYFHSFILRLQTKKVYLVSPHDNWPPVDKTGFSMDTIGNDKGLENRKYLKDYFSKMRKEKKKFFLGVTSFRFIHSRTYQEVQFQFLDNVDSFDPNRITHLLQMVPFYLFFQENIKKRNQSSKTCITLVSLSY